MLVHRGTTIIETNRLILRPFVMDDATNMFNNWASDSEVTKHLSWRAHSDITIAKGLMQMWVDSYSMIFISALYLIRLIMRKIVS
ncbi:MAG TPA: hypothetical protein VIM42_05285 [Clostridium sp.]